MAREFSSRGKIEPRSTAEVMEESPRQGFLVFDSSEQVLHVSRDLKIVLSLAQDASTSGLSVMELLDSATVPDDTGAATLRSRMFLATAPLAGAPSATTMPFKMKNGRTLQAQLELIEGEKYVALFEDVTSKLEAESTAGSAYTDHLTGIGNRPFLERALDEAMDRVRADETEQLTLFFLDLDRFKVINDTLGHAIGDELLKLVSGRLQSSLRASDTLSRMGGDEFAILLSSSPSREVAAGLAARIIDMIQRPYLIEGQVMNVGASIGIAVAPEHGTTRDELLRCADLALYYSKGAGRGVFHFFQPAMEEKAQQRRALEVDLRKALMLKQFELHYQPLIDSESHHIVGVEALLRWRHPQRGVLLPKDFLPLAEELGLAVPIADWMLKIACRDAYRLPNGPTLTLNMTALQFEADQFVSSVERALAAVELPGNRLEIQLTEDILQNERPSTSRKLDALRSMGVMLVMGNFGTGLASLSQLVNFTFDKIKIDPSLFGTNEEKHLAIVRAIAALGQTLGISTFAEGLTTGEGLAQVRSEGCDGMHGFYHSKIVPSSELAALFLHPLPGTDQLEVKANQRG